MIKRLARRLIGRIGRRRAYLGAGALLTAALVAAALLTPQVALPLSLIAIAAVLAVVVLDVRNSRVLLHQLRRHLGRAQRQADELARELTVTRRLLAASIHDQASAAGDPPEQRLPAALAPHAAGTLLGRGDVLAAHALAAATDSFSSLGLGTRRRLRTELQQRGYLTSAIQVARSIEGNEETEHDRQQRKQIEGEVAVLSGAFTLAVRPEAPDYKPVPGRVLHLVGRSLPEDQAGYTLRTHYIATAQREIGLQPHVVTQMGFAHTGNDYAQFELDGIQYHRLPGPRRDQVPQDTWLSLHAQRVANLVRVVRPEILHAASDYLNAQTAVVVGRAFGIPVVYETRGFWEETWLSRNAQRYGWDLERLAAAHGLPDTYRWRRAIEDRLRREADRVVTLAPLMADRIEAGGVPADRITVVPNGVAVADFPVLTRDRELAAELGIDPDTTVIGYISSLVEYEGVDTLIEAYATLRATSNTPVALLIVGDGLVRSKLVRQAEDMGLEGVWFTGRVPHDAVLRYYSLIDLFVVPRRPVEVCHLVTPLKPFEAFATGRTVVLSNVRALAAIAGESGAAELFRAGDAHSLAEVLSSLLKDPGRCKELADTGAAWVRAERSWTAHAQTYVRIYQELGVFLERDYRVPHEAASAIDLPALRSSITQRPPIPYECLASADRSGHADEIIEHGWRLEPYPPVPLRHPVDWTTLCANNRSWNYSLHAWSFMAPALRAHSRTGERRYLDWCVELAVSWASVFNRGDARGTMAWYDMALGQRGHRLAYLVEQAIRQDVDRERLVTLLACVFRHQHEYLAGSAFSPRTNHGVYVALGQLALARRLQPLPGMDRLAQQGRERLELMTRSQFAPDGGHVEHSPEYHRMMLDTFRGGIEAGLIEDSELRRRLAGAEDVLGWFIQPNGELVQVGDSSARVVRSKRARTTSPTTEFLVTEGGSGEPDSREMLVLPDTGLAVVRSPQPTGTDDHAAASYLCFAAGFHSQTHKHADDLNVTWFDRGREILVDAGRYGYGDLLPKDSPLRARGYVYSAPERQYVESTRAHNTVEVDALDHVRRGRKPYGSALTGTDQRDGYFLLTAAVDHGPWRHERRIVLCPGSFLYVVDTVESMDDRKHDFRVWWNLPEELGPVADDRGRLRVDSFESEPLWLVELTGAELIAPVVGQREPLRGWRSKQDLNLTPAWSVGLSAVEVTAYTFRTLLQFSTHPPTQVPDHPFSL